MAHSVFNKILGKRDKGLEIFHLPDKKYCHDSKKLSKMQKKDLLDEIETMQKYISNVCNRLDQGRKQYQKSIQKYDECSQKLNVLNSKMAMISNQHEQLQVKFSNLQNSLQLMTKQKQSMYKSQLQFIESKQLAKQKIIDMASIMKIYRDQVMLVEKIAHQNKLLKQKYSQLQSDFFNLSDKIAENKNKKNGQQLPQNKNTRQETEPDDQKNYQYKLLLETKQQMIVLLNKKINQQNDKKNQLQEKISDLHHEIQRRTTEIKQNKAQIQHLQNEIADYKRKIASGRQQFESAHGQAEQTRQQIRKKTLQIERINNQLVDLRQKLQLSEQQKRILMGQQNQTLQKQHVHEKQIQIERQKTRFEISAKDRQIEALNEKLEKTQIQKKQYQDQLNGLKELQRENYNLKENLLQQTKKSEQLSKKLENLQENYEIRVKKLEFTSNQQRIKAEGLKRSLTILQQKQEENQKKLNQMYQKKMVQDNKYAKMQNKMKEYKQLIQYLKKQKIELQKTFENKMKNMEQIVLHQQQQDNKNQGSEPSDKNDRNIIQEDEAIIIKLNSKIADLEEKIQFLKEENKMMATQKTQLEQSNFQLQKNVKLMNDKREQVIKQIKKFTSIDNPMARKSSQEQSIRSSNHGRQRKIAEKALKGFDIMSKQLSSLYKQFINVHMADISRRQVKQMEGNINGLVGKCEDMKDVFQGYL